jgi:hypothetical protein
VDAETRLLSVLEYRSALLHQPQADSAKWGYIQPLKPFYYDHIHIIKKLKQF